MAVLQWLYKKAKWSKMAYDGANFKVQNNYETIAGILARWIF